MGPIQSAINDSSQQFSLDDNLCKKPAELVLCGLSRFHRTSSVLVIGGEVVECVGNFDFFC